ncbi:MAG TPA: DUF4912 domain-containing protein [Fibrobacteria bacterium]|nr:DUF4912 domain-containing protein [Fibrobacteria bacterium]
MQKAKRGQTNRTPAKKKSAKKATTKTLAKKSPVKNPVAKKSLKKPVAKGRGPEAERPKQAAPKKVVAKKSAAKKPAAKKKVAKKAAKKITTKKPAAKKTAPPPRRPKSFAIGEHARNYGFAEGAPELPEAYGEDRLTLMVKDPDYLFAYWEITPERFAQADKTKHAGAEYREAMRLNWEARGLFEANYALMPVSLSARRWYVRVPHSGLSYRLEIGWLGSQGHFISLLDSNVSDSPESWSATRRRLKRSGLASRGGVLEYNLEAARPLGASETGFGRARPSSGPETPDFGAPGSLGSSFGSGALRRASKGSRA